MSSSYETNIGTILPTKVNDFKTLYSTLIDKFIVFQPKSITYKGTVKWFGEINNIKAFGIETDSIEWGTDGVFNKHEIFKCENECGVLIEESVKYLEIDEYHGFVEHNKFKVDEKHANLSKLVFVIYKKECRLAKILNRGFIKEIICYAIEIIKESKKYFVIKNDVLKDFVNDDGKVSLHKDAVLIIENCDEAFSLDIGKKVCFQFENKNEIGVLKWKGKIDGLKCIGVDPTDARLASDFKKHFKTDAYWVIICLDILEEKGIGIKREIDDPSNHGIFTYFKKNTYVKINDDYGIIKSFFIEKENFFYEIETELDEIIIAKSSEVKSGIVAKEHSGFIKMENPNEFGLEIKFTTTDHIQVKSNTENKLKKPCSGIIVWMGFDGDGTLKFLINLDESNEHANGGYFYGQKLYDIKNKHGLLVIPDCVIPFGYVPGNENHDCPPESPIVEEYQIPLSKITCGDNKGIQGDKNSCYMDTSLFAMFSFQELFDNLLTDPKDKINEKLVDILRSQIIFPLRKNEYVSFNRVSEFRKSLGELYPDKKFLHSEKDPEELLETLFHLLTPKDPLLKTFDIKSKNYQNCFMTQLFYVSKNTSDVTTIKEMLDRTFLESGILINKPPKGLILQLPRHGTHFKQYSEVDITPTLDITHLIRYGEHKCSQCSHTGDLLCLECSGEKTGFIYLCSNHKTYCTHKKSEFIDKEFPISKGKIRLELFAILCIEKTHYVAYVKTGEVLDKWIYYDSMATSDRHILKPLIRDTSIGKYFSRKDVRHTNFDEDPDIIRIKKFAFVCFYKNQALEYYSKDFNRVED